MTKKPTKKVEIKIEPKTIEVTVSSSATVQLSQYEPANRMISLKSIYDKPDGVNMREFGKKIIEDIDKREKLLDKKLSDFLNDPLGSNNNKSPASPENDEPIGPDLGDTVDSIPTSVNEYNK